MPMRYTFASTLILAGALAGAGLSALPSHASDLDGARVLNPELHAVQDDPEARDLRPVPKQPGYGQVKRPLVTLRASSPVVRVGRLINFEVGSSINGFGHIYVLSASGQVQVWMENVPIAASQRLLFPTGGIDIRAAAPAGRDDLMLIVTRSRVDGFLGYGTTRSPRVLGGYDHQAFKEAVSAKFMDLPRREWGSARATVEVVDGSSLTWGWGAGTADRWAGQWEAD